MLVGAVAIFGIVMALVLAAVSHRGDGSKTQPAERDTRVSIWGLGLGFPIVILVALTGYGIFVGERLLPRDVANVVIVKAEARQWAWTFRYAGSGNLETNGVLHIPAGRPVNVEITSVDVIHSFLVPQLAGKLDAIPGHVNVLRLEAAKPGIYDGQSAEFSGTGYREHVFTVQAHDSTSWATFLKEGI